LIFKETCVLGMEWLKWLSVCSNCRESLD